MLRQIDLLAVSMKRFGIAVLVAILLAVTAFLAYSAIAEDLCVTVENTGKHAMSEVTVHVTGQSCFLGDLPPGDSLTHVVAPTSESHVEVEFVGNSGKRVRLNAGGYIEPGYRGQIHVRIKDESVEAVTDTVHIGPY
jgi:hypothetical protein